MSRRRIILFLLVWTFHAAAPRLYAQSPHAPVFLESDHWSASVLRRLHGAHLVGRGYDMGSAMLTRQRFAEALDTAESRARLRGDAMLPQVIAWRARLAAESTGRSDAELAIGLQSHRDPAVSGYIESPESLTWSPATAAEDTAGVMARATTAVRLGRFGAGLQAELVGQDLRVPIAYVSVAAGPVGLWAGRRPLAVRGESGGGIVFNGSVPLNAMGVWLLRPLRVPLAGPVQFETFAGPMGAARGVDEAWMWGTNITFEPFEWLQMRATRGTMVASVDGTGIPLDRLVRIILIDNGIAGEGRLAQEVAYPDNTVVSFGGSIRSPAASLPLWFYLSWGADDSAGAWWSMPGVVGGLHLAQMPGAPRLDVGIEQAFFGRGDHDVDDIHLDWYRHGRIRDGWTDDLHPIGYPLGGHGREWSLYGGVDVDGPTEIMAAWRVFTRQRGSRNIFAPFREGRSNGARLDAEIHLNNTTAISPRLSYERGSGWSELSTAIGISKRFW